MIKLINSVSLAEKKKSRTSSNHTSDNNGNGISLINNKKIGKKKLKVIKRTPGRNNYKINQKEENLNDPHEDSNEYLIEQSEEEDNYQDQCQESNDDETKEKNIRCPFNNFEI